VHPHEVDVPPPDQPDADGPDAGSGHGGDAVAGWVVRHGFSLIGVDLG
jgi:hypothetical protein